MHLKLATLHASLVLNFIIYLLSLRYLIVVTKKKRKKHGIGAFNASKNAVLLQSVVYWWKMP